jgi:hypothetical protein
VGERQGQLFFTNWQKFLRRAMLLSPKKWPRLTEEGFSWAMVNSLIAQRFLITLEWNEPVPTAHISVLHSTQAVILSIQLEKLQGADFKVCARPDCQEPPFRVGARAREYCSYDCAHLMAVRRSRKQAKKMQEGVMHKGKV